MSAQDKSTTASTNDSGNGREPSAPSGQFAKLTDLKRGSGQNNAEANRQSFTEQTKAAGSLGAMWDSFTKGTTHK